ncbi:ArsR/SmtB family transcription factor [Zhouia sp. PK063]|uniref:ArsR/SmtB family transcription factor n=1 Tax=Zhouia sp. PK063 TaxID=3373602 RepID=UPI0037895DF7
MGLTKNEIFTPQQNKLAQLTKAIAHPARIAIIEYLIKADACICGDLVNEIGLAQPTISQHLKELKTAGIIKGTVEGTKMCYCIDKEKWASIQKDFETFFNQITNTNSCC